MDYAKNSGFLKRNLKFPTFFACVLADEYPGLAVRKTLLKGLPAPDYPLLLIFTTKNIATHSVTAAAEHLLKYTSLP